MKKLIILILFTLTLTSCIPIWGNDEDLINNINHSFKCMWTGECN